MLSAFLSSSSSSLRSRLEEAASLLGAGFRTRWSLPELSLKGMIVVTQTKVSGLIVHSGLSGTRGPSFSYSRLRFPPAL